MGHTSRIQPTVVPLRYQAVRTFSTGAQVVIAAFETELDAELFASVSYERGYGEPEVRLDPILAAKDAEMRTLVRNLNTTHPADEDLEPLGTPAAPKPCGFCEADGLPGDNDHCVWDGTPHYWHHCDSDCAAGGVR